MKLRLLAAAGGFAVLTAGPAAALPVTFFGEDQSPAGSVDPAGAPAVAQGDFLATLAAGVGTEDFETRPVGDFATLGISFPGSTGAITATLSGPDLEVDGSAGSGRFATSGSRFVELDDGEMLIEFSDPIAAFGFFGTDVGDIGEQLAVTLFEAGTLAETEFLPPHDTNANNGSLLFWGFVDTETSYSSIRLGSASGSGDVFGFDDLTIGDVGQIVNPPRPSGEVPLPAAGWMLIAGLGALAGLRRARKG
ncbi:MAG: VPLPA-CTERM sorting domain-containing protein [Pseudomonadota bacterium]